MLRLVTTCLLASTVAAPLANAGDYQVNCNYSIGSIQTGYVADFDQLRDHGDLIFDGQNWFYDPLGLASGGNPAGGWNFCVPTASTNWLAWIANHGYPEVMPATGAGNFSNPDVYNDISWTIGELGILMNTNAASGGTTGDGLKNGLEDWFNQTVGPNVFDVGYQGVSTDPSLFEIGAHGHAGHLVMVTIGWYEEVTNGYFERNGGHITTVTGAFDYCGNTSAQIRFRDPASDYIFENYLEQSAFTDETYDLEYITADFDGTQRTLARVVGYGSTYPLGDLQPIIDGFSYITPVQGLGTGPNGDLVLHNPNGMGDIPPTEEISLNYEEIKVFSIDPNLRTLYYQGVGDPMIWTYDLLNEEIEPLVQHGVLKGIGKMVGGIGGGLLYTLEAHSLCAWDLQTSPPTLVECRSMSFPADSMVIDECTESVLVLSQQGRVIIEHDMSACNIPPVFYPIPAAIELDGDPHFAITPDDCTLWLSSSDDRVATLMKREPAASQLIVVSNVDHPKLINSTSIVGGEDGTFFFGKGGELFGFEYDNGWQLMPQGGFVGLPSSGDFVLLQAPWAMEGDELSPHILPNMFSDPEPEVCLGDVDGDFQIGVPDMLALLGAWGPNAGHELDLNDDGTINTLDLLIMLAAWGQCA